MKKNLIIVGLLAVAVVTVVGIKNAKHSNGGCSSCCSGGCPAPDATEARQCVMLPRLLDLGSDQCVPCKMMDPILAELKSAYTGQLDVEFIDVWKDEEASALYGIRMIPTQVFFDVDGNELFRHEGFFAKEDILAKWQELGFEFEVAN
ncbi:MAG: thioredoxin family protein [Pontiellaceae bacterium]|nr:thioredoxin family protein [Pontiellaceae bacterium]MBN2786410.1 thioredoxin family protein [Pontiellaceae bacterium]